MLQRYKTRLGQKAEGVKNPAIVIHNHLIRAAIQKFQDSNFQASTFALSLTRYMTRPESTFYVTGGTLRHDAPSYVERQADKDLLNGLVKGEFCYVLTSRQMGKSSLMVRTANKLREQGTTVVVLDLTAVGQNLAPEQWYGGLLSRLGHQLRMEDTLDDFWFRHETLGPCQRFFTAIQRIVLPALLKSEEEALAKGQRKPRVPGVTRQGAERLVIFVDELDVVRSLAFSTDEFFAAIRECYTRRAEDPDFNQLTFCLLGVATPSDLIRNTQLTPFNIGKRIELRDFEEHEALALADALGHPPQIAQRMLRRILCWTSGHPYLTQRLCQAAANHPTASGTRGVNELCREIFFSNRARERDDNLLFVRERLLRSEVDLINLLRLYRRVHRSTQIASFFRFHIALRKIEPVADEETNPLVSILRLSGVTKVEKGILRVRNRIYHRVFDPAWVEANMPVAELWRRWLTIWGAIKRAGAFIATAFIVLLLTSVALAVWTRPWERVRFERTPRTARHVNRPKPHVPLREAAATPAMIDLSGFYNAALNEAWYPGPRTNNLSALPPGLKKLAGVEFDVRGLIQLAGMNLGREGFPEAVRGIAVRQKCQRFHFLHAAAWKVPEGTQIGNYVIRYADGKKRFIPILYGQDVSDWLVTKNEKPDKEFETLAWKEPSEASGSENRSKRLFKSTWGNPFPEVEVLTIDYTSTMTDAAPFLIAISVEPR